MLLQIEQSLVKFLALSNRVNGGVFWVSTRCGELSARRCGGGGSRLMSRWSVVLIFLLCFNAEVVEARASWRTDGTEAAGWRMGGELEWRVEGAGGARMDASGEDGAGRDPVRETTAKDTLSCLHLPFASAPAGFHVQPGAPAEKANACSTPLRSIVRACAACPVRSPWPLTGAHSLGLAWRHAET